jgi:hypothetical protein
MINLQEMRRLYKIRVECQGNNLYFFRVVNYDNIKSLTLRTSKEGLRKFLIRIKAKDTKTTPSSMRGITYKIMVDDILTGIDNEIWVWSNKWKPATKKFMEI